MEKKIRILLLGESYHAKVFCDQVNEYIGTLAVAEYNEDPLDDIDYRKYDIIHLISPPLRIIKKLIRFNKPIFFHWIGTDVYRFSKDWFFKKQMKRLLIKKSGIHNLVVNENLKNELVGVGIISEVLPLVKLNFVKNCPPFPENFSILTYLPKSRWEFYRGDMILEIAGLLPDVDFQVLCSENISNTPLNVRTYDFIEDMSTAYKESNALLRITEHDGLSKMVLEALSYGRHVMWSSPFPYTHLVDSVQKSVTTIKKLKSNSDYNLEGKKFVEQNYNPENICNDYLKMCKKLIALYD